jgi:RNA polymerase sigma factor (sigma-70 family)
VADDDRGDATASLIDRALARDPWALRALVERLRGSVQWEAKGVLERSAPARRPRAQRQDLEDLVQEIFYGLLNDDARALRAWKHDGGRSLENFVRWYARRQAISILRTGKRRPWLGEPALEETEETTGSTADLLPVLEARNLLATLLEQLPLVLGPEQLHLFELAFIEDLPADKICQQLQLSSEVVYQRLSRLRRQVRAVAEQLTTDGPPPRR